MSGKNKFENKVVYQIYPKSYMDTNGDGIGDIKGIISKIDYLKDLGVDYIWLSPINKSPQHDNGYDISDYYEIEEMFGTKEEYKELVMEAKKRNMSVMLDLVLNHTSNEHVWFQKALKGDKKYKDFYVWTKEPNELNGFFSQSAWEYVEEFDEYYLHLFDRTQPDLNWHNPEVREEIYKMVNYWIDFGIEGFRLDVIDLIAKEPEKMITAKGPKFYEYLKELHDNTFKNDLLTVGECWNATLEEAESMCTDGLTQVFHFEHLITTNGKDKWEQNELNLDTICSIIEKWQNKYDLAQTQVMNNHDLPRLASLWFGEDTKYYYEQSTLLATVFNLLKGTVYIYQGEEIGMRNIYLEDINKYNDVETIKKYEEFKKEGLKDEEIMPKIKLISRDNARVPFAWDNTTNGGFSSAIPWTNLSQFEQINLEKDLVSDKSITSYYKNLLSFRKENYDTMIDKPLDYITNNNGVITYKKGNLVVVANFTNDVRKADFKDVLFSNIEMTQNLEAYQVVVYSYE